MATSITSSATIELPMFDEHGGQIKDINGFLCFQKIGESLLL